MFGTQHGDLLACIRATCKLTGTNSTISQYRLALGLVNKDILELALAKASLSHGILDSLSAKRSRW